MSTHRRFLFSISALALAAALAAAPAAQAKEVLTPLTVDASFNASDAAANGFTLADNKALKGIKRVAVPVFAVEFMKSPSLQPVRQWLLLHL